MKRKLIIVTDGDRMAKEAVEIATNKIGGSCISMSAGNPTKISGKEILDLISKAKKDPVVVMVDDRGNTGIGSGEAAMNVIIKDENIETIGIIAVASNTYKVKGVKVDCSIDKYGNVINNAVDKHGNTEKDKILKGDTVDILSKNNNLFIVGIGDPGKMEGNDKCNHGAPIITRAMKEIINNYYSKKS